MHRLFKLSAVFIGVLISGSRADIYSQITDNKSKDTITLKSADGIYPVYNTFKSNNPVPLTRIILAKGKEENDLFQNLYSNDEVIFFDDSGTRHEIARTSIWGLIINDIIYIQYNGQFSPITLVGNICHFSCEMLDYNYKYGPTTNHNYPLKDPNSIITLKDGSIIYDPYKKSHTLDNPQIYEIPRINYKQYLIDFGSGDIMEFNPKNTELLLRKDNKLLEEFKQLPKKAKEDLMYMYIKRFNENNPLEPDGR